MAVTNTGIVLRTIVGVNESDLFLDSEATSVTTNTGIVERSIVGVHDANFVHPIGDELISNGGFATDSNWALTANVNISNGKLNFVNAVTNDDYANQSIVAPIGKTYKITLVVSNLGSGQSIKIRFPFQDATINSNGTYTIYGVSSTANVFRITPNSPTATCSIDNISVKEMLVNRESTTTNTGIVERAITGSNESELWLDESTSVVNNTGIVERPITGVNESDPMFPDNTISNIRNINDTTLYEELLEALQLRAAYYENEEGTTEILTNLFNC